MKILKPLIFPPLFLMIALSAPGFSQEKQVSGKPVKVTVDYKTPVMVSQFEIGVTYTGGGWEKGSPEILDQARQLIKDANIRFQNHHIFGWGAVNPEPDPGDYNWTSLDTRMNFIRSMGNATPVITFCGAPGWMKDYNPKAKYQIEIRVRDSNVGEFAALCKKVALRYPDVVYFQIWNEFKGYWVNKKLDYKRFTDFYNAVYDSVKKARPDAKIGGPYLPMGGGSIEQWDQEVVEYWRDNCHGADFFTFDGWLEGWPPGGHTEEWMMGKTDYFGNLVERYKGMVNMPVWISEYYAGSSKNPDFTAANFASTYCSSLKSGARMALLWGTGLGQLFVRSAPNEAPKPTPQYYVVKAFNTYFGPGTQIFKTQSSSVNVDVLASKDKIMLINKLPDSVTVNLNRKKIQLRGYEVSVVDSH